MSQTKTSPEYAAVLTPKVGAVSIIAFGTFMALTLRVPVEEKGARIRLGWEDPSICFSRKVAKIGAPQK